MEINITDYLKSKPNFIFKANPGNGGDCIISSSIWQTFDSLNLNYTNFNKNIRSLEKCNLIYSGGGNLVNKNSYSTRFITENYKKIKHLTILPHTIKDCDELLAGFNGNVDIICRERQSYEYVKAQAPRAKVYLAHDMAFNLDINQFIKKIGKIVPPSTLRYLFDRYVKNKTSSSWRELKRMSMHTSLVDGALSKIKNDTINCFRVDGESARNGNYPDGNVDLSELFTFGSISRDAADFGSSTLINVLSQCNIVNTDRLHVAITAALLNKTVNLYTNNYYKIREIYRYSIYERYKNVIWHDEYFEK
ncbi:polysaccharide pyruvyl transferase family protein [bacterium]|nr:polysaccharide pyruvyl transferase family protein [bacterium]